MRKLQQQTGFTLIELLFIVVLLGIFAALLVSSFEQRTLNTKVERTGVEMQQFLTAGLAFYADNSRWPDPTNNQDKTNFLSNYLPVTGQNANAPVNPWGKPYLWAPDQNNNFTVQSGSLLSSSSARRVMSLLPSANLVASDATQVTAKVSPFPLQYPQIGAIGEIDKAQNGLYQPLANKQGKDAYPYIPPFACPSGWYIAYLFGIPRNIYPQYYPSYPYPPPVKDYCPGGSGPLGVESFGSYNSAIKTCAIGIGGWQAYCSFSVSLGANVPYYSQVNALPICATLTAASPYTGSVDYTYIGVCVRR